MGPALLTGFCWERLRARREGFDVASLDDEGSLGRKGLRSSSRFSTDNCLRRNAASSDAVRPVTVAITGGL